MYQRIVRRRVHAVFDNIGRRDLEPVLAGLAPDVHHRFAGDHPLGGERHTRDGVAAWFQRLFRLYPQLTFILHEVTVTGPPWDVRVAVEWTARAVPVVGEPYDNQGAHVLRIQRGKVTHLHAYEDSQAVGIACAHMCANGVKEAAAPPIED